jgi:hypothetical protein
MLSFRATRMNWMMTMKTMMNTESMSTIPPLAQTIIMTSDCQLVIGMDAVAIQAQNSR